MAKFLSKCPNQVLCIKPNRVQIADGIAMPVTGEHIRFNNGEYETSDKKEIQFIKNHRLFGFEITEAEEAKTAKKDADKQVDEKKEDDKKEDEKAGA